ncbi:glycosyltransferase family 4 protein [Arthrobacter sp. NA-172]|uniref:glycosyltransferase family 4 protein n=1 Tax=Arthrobacter sp. NA-172 TaxID=3367524 RepID=UPI003754F845
MSHLLNITFLLPGYSPNPIGGYKVAYEYANHLARLGNDVKIIHAWRFSMDESGADKPIDILRRVRYMPEVVRNTKPGWFNFHSDVRIINKFLTISRDLDGSDIVVATACQSAPITNEHSLAGKSSGVYFIQHYEDWSKDASFVDRTWKLPLRKVVIAPWLQEKASELGVAAELVPNAIDADRFAPGPAIPARPLSVTAIVSPQEWKRTDLVCEVLALAKATVPDLEGTTFGVCPRPEGLPAWVQHVQQPAPADLSAIYQRARVYLCASDAEGWHLPPAEAMMSGTAVVSTNIGGVRAYADGSALFSPTGDAEALADNVVRLLTDEAECTRLAEAGYAKLSGYTSHDAASAFTKVIESAAENCIG